MAGFALRQAETVVANITALVGGGTELAAYKSAGAAILVPIGPEGGAGQFPGADGQASLIGSEAVAEFKGRHMMVERFTTMFGLTPPPTEIAEPAIGAKR